MFFVRCFWHCWGILGVGDEEWAKNMSLGGSKNFLISLGLKSGIGMHSLYGESKSVPGLVHARSCVSFCVCGEIRWASRKRKVTYCWPNFPWSALLSPSACQTSLLPHSKELRVCKDRGGRKGRNSEKVGGMKRGSPVQGAPASCRPGDGLDIASPLSSEKKTKRQWMLVNMLFYKAITSITCNTDTYQKQTFVWFSTAASHMNKIYKISKT